MMASGGYSIAGGWLGTYRYYGLLPVRFEATFSGLGEEFDGEILDESYPGLATVGGSQHGAEIRFTKVYVAVKSPDRSKSVSYEGRISEDGKQVRGTWSGHLPYVGLHWLKIYGDWEARRTWLSEEAAYAESDQIGQGLRGISRNA